MPNNITIVEYLNHTVYPRLSAEIIFSDLDGLKKEKSGITATCPSCGRASHFFCYYNGKYGKCHAGSCDAGQKAISWWEHTAKRYNLSRNRDILHKLAELAGVEIPNNL